jgi:hypothetical protein
MTRLHITHAEHAGGYQLHIWFNDNTNGEVNLANVLTGPVFELLQSVDYFKQFRIADHTVTWENGADFSAEYLHNLVFSQASMSQSSYKKSDEADKLVESIKLIVSFLLDESNAIHPKHRKRFLDRCVWQLTEAQGKRKYDLRYVSENARLRLEQNVKKGLRHEHVLRRAKMVQRLMEHPAQAASILDQAIGCVVTIEDHKLLDEVDRQFPDVNGWERYRLAGIKVYDRALNHFVAHDELIAVKD